MAVIELKQVPKAFFGLGARGGGRAQGSAPAHLPGYTDVVNADLSRYFDSVSPNELLKLVARRVADGSVLRLIKLSLKGAIEENGIVMQHGT